MADDVTLTHPEGYDPITAPEHRARILCRQGWERAGGASDVSDEVADDASDEARSRAAHPSAKAKAASSATTPAPTTTEAKASTSPTED